MYGKKIVSAIGNSYRSWEYDLATGLLVSLTVISAVSESKSSLPYFAAATGLHIAAPIALNCSSKPILNTYDFFKKKLGK